MKMISPSIKTLSAITLSLSLLVGAVPVFASSHFDQGTNMTSSSGWLPPGIAKKLNGWLPPGLAKKGGLPPGIAKKIVRDTQAPIISDVAVRNIMDRSAAVTWTTNESANGKVFFSTGSPVSAITSSTTIAFTSTGRDHIARLRYLIPGTTYHAIVVSTDSAGNTAKSDEFTFTTTANASDTVAPQLSNIQAQNITTTSAKIHWNTDERTNSKVVWDSNTPVDLNDPSVPMTRNSSLVFDHNSNLSGLNVSTTYFYVVVSTDASGNIATSSEQSFTTLGSSDVTPPVISNVVAVAINFDREWIGWMTNEPATSVVWYNTVSPVAIGSPSLSVSTAGLVQNRTLDLMNLTANTNYFYTIVSTDASGNTSTTNGSFTTINNL